MTILKLTILAAGALAIAGCAVIGPDYEAPSLSSFGEAGFINSDGYATDAALASWWTLFGDAQLDAMIAEGLAENRSLGAAIANVNASRAQWGLARLNRLPTDTATGSYLESRQGSAVFAASTGLGSAAPFPTNDISTVDIAAVWEVDLFGRVTRTINVAKADLGEAQALLADLSAIIAADIAEAYVTVRGLSAQVSVARENVANQLSTVELTQATRDAGRGTDLDVERAKAQLAGTRALIPVLEASIAAASYRLGVLTGRTPEEITALLAASSGEESVTAANLPLVVKPIPIGDTGAFLRRRPDIAASERALASATERIGLNLSEAFPRVDLIGQAGYQAVGFNDQFSASALNFSAGPSITWSITNLVRARQTVRAARAGAEAAFNAYEGAVLAALAETESALIRQRSLQAQLVELTEAERASGEAARLARLRYENGATDFLEVLDAERRDLEAADRLAAARTDLAQAQVAVFRSLRAGPVAVATTPDRRTKIGG